MISKRPVKYQSNLTPLVFDAPGMLQRTMSWSPENTITSIVDGIHPLASQSFSYDLADRLTYASGVYGMITYSYDGNGNRLSKTDAAGTQSYAYQAGTNHLVQTITPWARYTYDGAGNQTRASWFSYSYGADNRLSQTASAYNGLVYGSYVYNGKGERAIRHGIYGGGTTYYVYDEQGQLLGEYDANGTSINEYAYGPTGREARLAYWGGIYTYYNDHLGTAQVITNASQNVLWEADYKPFGEVAAVRRNPNGNAWQFWNNLRFPGQIWDYSSQTIYNYFRNLDPKTGRYTQHDPIGLNGGMNPFAYVGGNPVIYVDPKGLVQIDIGGSFAGGNYSSTLYDSMSNTGLWGTGFFPIESTLVKSFTTELIGGGISIIFPQPSNNNTPSDGITTYIGASRSLSLGFDNSKGEVSINVGLGFSPTGPVSFEYETPNKRSSLSQCGR